MSHKTKIATTTLSAWAAEIRPVTLCCAAFIFAVSCAIGAFAQASLPQFGHGVDPHPKRVAVAQRGKLAYPYVPQRLAKSNTAKKMRKRDATVATALSVPRLLRLSALGASGGCAPAGSYPAPIVALASALKCDPDLIFEYVYNNIEFEPLYGSNKGALGTLLDGRGGDADQAILLVTLWNAAGLTQTGYYNETLQLTGPQIANWFGVPNDCLAIENLINGGGIPYVNALPSTCSAGQSLTSIQVNHFVAALNISGAWYYFDPSYKQHSIVAGLGNLASVMGYSRSQFLSDVGGTIGAYSISGANRANLRSDLVKYANNLVSYINQNNRAWRQADVIGGKLIIPLAGSPIRIQQPTWTPSSTFPAVCPNQSPSGVECRTSVSVVMPGATVSNAIKLYTDQVYGHRITISSVVSGGAYIPTLLIDGAAPSCVAAGTCVNTGTSISSGTWSMCTVVTEPNQSFSTSCAGSNATDSRNLTYAAGGSYLLSVAVGGVGRGMAEYHRQLLESARAAGNADMSEIVFGESLATISYNWFAQNSNEFQITDQFAQSVSLYRFGVGITGQANIQQSGYQGPYVDLPMNDVTIIARNSAAGTTSIGPYSYSTPFVSAALTQDATWSSFESAILLQTLAPQGTVTAASSVALVDANMNPAYTGYTGVTYFADGTTTAGKNYFNSTILPAITGHYSSTDVANISNYVNSLGYQILLPKNGQLAFGHWSGAGYFSLNPQPTSLASLALISGGMSGGFFGWPVSYSQLSEDTSIVLSPVSSTESVSFLINTWPSTLHFTFNDPVDAITGALEYSATDLVTGGGSFPYALPFARTYLSSAGTYLTSKSADNGMGNGWSHSYNYSATVESDPYIGMGAPITPAIDTVSSIVALYVMQDLSSVSPSAQTFALTAMAAQWFTDQLTGNTVKVAQPSTTEEFVVLPHADGATSLAFSPPPGSSARFSQTAVGQFVYKEKDGTTLNFGAAPSGALQNIVYPSGVVVTFAYTGSQLTTVSNNLGRSLSLSYAGSDITKVTDDTGRYVSYAYDSNHNLTTYTDPLLHNTAFSYDATGKYDTAAHLTQIFYPTNPTNPFVTNYYDPMGRVAQQANANGSISQLYISGPRSELVDAIGNRHVTYQTARGKVTNDFLVLSSGFGNVFNDTPQQNGVVNVTLNTYDGIDRPLTTTAPEGDSVAYAYVTSTNPWANNVASVTSTPKSGSPLSPITQTLSYDPAFNKVKTATDGLGLITLNAYNAGTGTLARSISDYSPSYGGAHLNATTSYTYNSLGLPLTVTDPVGSVTSNVYDSFGNATSITRDAGGLNLVAQMGYDALGNVTSVTDPNGNVTGSTYDAKRRLSTVTPPYASSAPGPVVTSYTYAPDDWLLQTQQAVSGSVLRTTSSTYTFTGKAATATDANGNTTVYAYDGNDRLASVANPLGSVTSYAYDAVSRQTQVFNLAIQTAPLLQNAYRPDGALASLTDANGNSTNYAYDGFNRLQTVTYPAPTGGSTSTESFTYDADANVITATTRKGDVVAFSYDTLNRRCSKTIASTPVVCGGSSANPTTFYNYDLSGRLIAANDNSATIAVAGSSASYATSYSYDALNRPLNVTWNPAVTQTTPSASSVTFTHRYDGNNRRTSSGSTDTSWMSYPAATATTTSYTANQLNQYSQVGSVTPTYDADGNLTYDGVYTYVYNPENRLTSIKLGATTIATYAYDAQGRRKSKTVGGTTTLFVTDADNREVLEYDGTSGVANNWYAYGLGSNDVLNQMNVANGTRQTMIPDVQGSMQARLDASSGTLTAAGYQTYGENPDRTSGSFAYTGQRFDAETAGSTSQPSGLYYYRARMYSPTWGRFLQVDPIGYSGGVGLYAYTDNDPLNQTDPSGRCPWCVWGAAIGGGVELGVQFIHGNDPYHTFLTGYNTGNWAPFAGSIGKIGVASGAGAATGGVGTLLALGGAGAVATVGTTAFIGSEASGLTYAVNSCAIDRSCNGTGLAIAMTAGAIDAGGGGPLGELAAKTAGKFGLSTTVQMMANGGTQAIYSGLISGVGQEMLLDQFGNNSGSARAVGTGASSGSLGNTNTGNTSTWTASPPSK